MLPRILTCAIQPRIDRVVAGGLHLRWMIDAGGLLALGIHAVTAWTGLGGQAALKQAAHEYWRG